MGLTRSVCVHPGDIRKKWNKRYFVLVQTPAPLLLYYRHFQGVRCCTKGCAAKQLATAVQATGGLSWRLLTDVALVQSLDVPDNAVRLDSCSVEVRWRARASCAQLWMP